ncbi:unnamed protein product [Citrullus colocynthis]|uniref:Uncharacterized protein n=1 Tax=Citrullus colocynthis TaxID=252529 RepID=A0ABP0Z3I2_9ROSI
MYVLLDLDGGAVWFRNFNLLGNCFLHKNVADSEAAGDDIMQCSSYNPRSMLLLVDNIQIPGFTKIIVACMLHSKGNSAYSTRSELLHSGITRAALQTLTAEVSLPFYLQDGLVSSSYELIRGVGITPNQCGAKVTYPPVLPNSRPATSSPTYSGRPV